MDNTTLEIITIVIYLILLIAMGLSFASMNRNASDYFRSGGQGTWWLVGTSAFMSGFSAWTFTGAAGVAFEAGWSVSIIFLANAMGFFVNALCFAPWFRQLRAITVPEVIRDRFGPTTQQFYAWSNVPMRLLYSALHLYGLAIFSSAMFGLNLNLVIIGVGLIVLFYSAVGGSWAVMGTDFLQSLIMMPLTILIAVLCLVEVGGISGFFQTIQARELTDEFALIKPGGLFSADAFTWVWAGAMFLQGFFVSNSLGSASRYFAAKDGPAARNAAWLGGVLMLLGGWIWFIPPMVARLLFEADVQQIDIAKPAEAAYAVASAKLLPQGMSGIMIVAMFSATMSSMDTGLNQTAAIFTHDIIPAIRRWLGRAALSETMSLRLGQAISFLLGLIIIALTLYFASTTGTGIFEYMLNIGAMLGLPLAIPTLMALFIRRTPWWAAIFSVGCALIPSLISSLATEAWSFQGKVFIISAAGVAGYLLTLPFWSSATQAYRNQVTTFFTRMHTPVDFEREVGHSSDRRQLNITGWFGLLAAVLMCLLLLVPNDLAARIQILSLIVSIALICSLLLWAGSRRPADRPSNTTPKNP